MIRARRGLPLSLPPIPEQVRWGVEHEFRLMCGDEQADFRTLLPLVTESMSQLDPGDPRVRRLPSGAALTADGREAELASPPLPVSQESGVRIDVLLQRERTTLESGTLRHGVTQVIGFSTHLNISVPDVDAVDIGRRFLARCAPALASVTETEGSWGVLIRPRRGRLEFGGDYVDGPRLIAALTLMAACVEGLRAGNAPPGPPVLVPEPSREKFGWFLPDTGEIPSNCLDEVWQWARPYALGLGLDPDAVDHLPAGMPLSARQIQETSPNTLPRTLILPGLGSAIAETQWLTWAYAVWRIATETRECFAVIPAEAEPDFVRALDTGELAESIVRILREPVRSRRLLVNADISGPSLWHDLRPGALVPAERLGDGGLPPVSRRRAGAELRRSRRRVNRPW